MTNQEQSDTRPRCNECGAPVAYYESYSSWSPVRVAWCERHGPDPTVSAPTCPTCGGRIRDGIAFKECAGEFTCEPPAPDTQSGGRPVVDVQEAYERVFDHFREWAGGANVPDPALSVIAYRDAIRAESSAALQEVRNQLRLSFQESVQYAEEARTLEVRAEAAESEAAGLRAEVKRVRALIDLDRTGLALGLSEVRHIVRGHEWLADPEGGRGSYTDDEWDEAAIRREVNDLITGVDEAALKALTESGYRADAAYREPLTDADVARLGLVGIAAGLREQISAQYEKAFTQGGVADLIRERDEARASAPCLTCGAPNPLFAPHAYDEGEAVPGTRWMGHPYRPAPSLCADPECAHSEDAHVQDQEVDLDGRSVRGVYDVCRLCSEASDGARHSYHPFFLHPFIKPPQPPRITNTMTESLDSQIDRLAKFIMENIPGEPSQSEGAVDTAIRIMASALTRIDLLVSQREQLTSAVNVYRARAEAAEADLDTATRELSALSSDKQTLMTAVTHWRERAEAERTHRERLAATWEGQARQYPDSDEGRAAQAAVMLCARELRALAAPPWGCHHERR